MPAGQHGSSSAGLSFMSTQRRENRFSPAAIFRRLALRFRRRITQRSEQTKAARPLPVPPTSTALADGRTAPPQLTVRSATNSLHTDQAFAPIAWKVSRSGSPPLALARCSASFPPASVRPFRLVSSIPPCLESLHAASPQAPAALSRRAERYDGKRDLHFLNAA
jgi:hypothetical protein